VYVVAARRVHVLLRREAWSVGRNKVRRNLPRVSQAISKKRPSRADNPSLAGLTSEASRSTSRSKPTDNAFIEGFNGRFRADCLNAPWFLGLADAPKKFENLSPVAAIKPPITF
jgi:hypothetical protein